MRCAFFILRNEMREQKVQDTIIKFDHISMQFPGVLANDDVSLDIRKGEVLWLKIKK